MIIGIGTDIVEVGRIARLLKSNLHFVDKVFSYAEIAYASRKASPAQSYAARFAAKEAFMKAIGTGWEDGISWKEIEVINNSRGKPEIHLSGRALDIATSLEIDNIQLSMSHEKDYAIAYLILEAGCVEPGKR